MRGKLLQHPLYESGRGLRSHVELAGAAEGQELQGDQSRLAYYGDHVELTDGGDDFASQIGIGAVIGSKFTWPENNPAVEADYRAHAGEGAAV